MGNRCHWDDMHDELRLVDELARRLALGQLDGAEDEIEETLTEATRAGVLREVLDEAAAERARIVRDRSPQGWTPAPEHHDELRNVARQNELQAIKLALEGRHDAADVHAEQAARLRSEADAIEGDVAQRYGAGRPEVEDGASMPRDGGEAEDDLR